MQNLFSDLLRIVKLILLAAIALLFFRSLLYPNALDMFILLLLFVVFMTLIFGRR